MSATSPRNGSTALPWTDVRIQEAATETGTYTQIDTIALSRVDADPAAPEYRSFTTELGTALDYWYRVVFADATGDVSQPSSPVQNTAGSDVPVTVYGTVAELFRGAEDPTATVEQTAAAERIHGRGSSTEINLEMGRIHRRRRGQLAMAVESTYERAEELWNESEVPFGAIGLGQPSGPCSRPATPGRSRTRPHSRSWGVG